MGERHFSGWSWRGFALLLGAIGLYLAIMGGQLALLGGSLYYAGAGLLTIAAGLLVWRGDRRGAWLYGALLAATLAWSLWEVGTDPWQLVARLVAPAVLGLPFLLSTLWRQGGARLALGGLASLAGLTGAAVILLSTFHPAQAGSGIWPATPAGTDSDWRAFGRTDTGTRFAPFTEINQDNIGKLQVAWTYRAGHKFGQATPLKIGDGLYLCTSDNVVIALDAETGRQRWAHNPQIRPKAYGRSCRGVAYYENAAAPADGPCRATVYVSTRDARLIGLDTATGKPCAGFGQGGTVDLTQGMGGDREGYLYASSPPLVSGDLVIVANCVFDGQQVGEPSGVVRAFDARSGKFVWAWDPGNPDVNTEPGPGQHYVKGTPNVWSVMSVDPQLGLLFLPTGNATPDYFGGHRTKAQDRFSASIVALDVNSGKLRWAFQTVHHDIWDYDVGSQPVLFEFPTAGGRVPAVLQATKRGELFVLDRRTGVPLTKVEERPTPQGGTVPEDHVAPTQPFSTGMPSLMDADLTEADMWGITPLDQLWCRVKFRQARYEGTMTPIGLKPILRNPGSSGIYNWGSVSIDEDTGIMVAATLHLANYDRLIPKDSTEAQQFYRRDGKGHPEIGPGAGSPQRGTPYAVSNPPFFSPLAVPCTEPPFGRVSAIDLNTRKLLWSKPVGTTRNSGPWGIPSGISLPMGMPVNGGMLVTRGGLSFFAGSQDGYIRAYSTRSGAALWRDKLPAGTESTPMSYLAPKSGRQIIAVTVGGAVGSTEESDYLVAYALPRS